MDTFRESFVDEIEKIAILLGKPLGASLSRGFPQSPPRRGIADVLRRARNDPERGREVAKTMLAGMRTSIPAHKSGVPSDLAQSRGMMAAAHQGELEIQGLKRRLAEPPTDKDVIKWSKSSPLSPDVKTHRASEFSRKKKSIEKQINSY